MSELPAGWAETTLGELVFTRSGNSKLIKGKLPNAQEPGLFPAFSASGQDVWCPDAEYEGDGIVLSAVGARCGKAFLAVALWTAIANTHVILPASGIQTRFLWYLLNDERFWVRGGTAQPFVKVKASLETKLALPPTAEQRRIVAAIEEHLSRLDAAAASLAAASARVRSLHVGILIQALDRDWPVAAVGDVAEVSSGPAFKSSFFGGPGEGIRLLRGENIEPGALRWRDTRTWPESMLDGYEHLFVEQSDLILAMDRPVISSGLKLAPVRKDDLPALLVQRVARIRPSERMLTGFLHAVLQLPRFIPHVIGDQTGTQLPHITLAGIRAFHVPLPSLDEQQRIVAEIEERLGAIDALRAAIERAQRRGAALRRLILERGFRGELVPQDPSDEPASVLLDRIRAERAMSQSATGRRRNAVRP